MSSGNTINPYPLTNGVPKEGTRTPVGERSQPPSPTIPRSNNDNSQQAPKNQLTHSPSVRKKGVKDFEFGKTLGEGSYSTVVAARDRSNNREYAVKILDKKHIIKEKKVKYVNIEEYA